MGIGYDNHKAIYSEVNRYIRGAILFLLPYKGGWFVLRYTYRPKLLFEFNPWTAT
jgi:hypothetical protein